MLQDYIQVQNLNRNEIKEEKEKHELSLTHKKKSKKN